MDQTGLINLPKRTRQTDCRKIIVRKGRENPEDDTEIYFMQTKLQIFKMRKKFDTENNVYRYTLFGEDPDNDRFYVRIYMNNYFTIKERRFLKKLHENLKKNLPANLWIRDYFWYNQSSFGEGYEEPKFYWISRWPKIYLDDKPICRGKK